MKRLIEVFQRNTFARRSPRQRPKATRRRLFAALERLEPRLMLAADPPVQIPLLAGCTSSPTALVADAEGENGDQLRIRLEASQSVGGPAIAGPIDRGVDDTFLINVYVQDLRDAPQGVVGGAMDLGWMPDLVAVGEEIAYGDGFNLFQQGEVDNLADAVNEAGALAATSGLGAGGQTLFFSIEVVAEADGTVTFTGMPGHGTDTITPPHFALVGQGTPVEWDAVAFVDAIVQIVSGDDGTSPGISGFVYVDGNSNANFDGGETGIPNVVVTLNGVSNNILRSTMTDAQGAYSFDSLPGGTYDVRQTHPIAFFDGEDQIGSAGGTAGNDHFSGIQITASEGSSQNNFGELGLRPEFFSRRIYLASSPAFSVSLGEIVAATQAAADAALSQADDWLEPVNTGTRAPDAAPGQRSP